jgi:hypothetical protein
MQTLHKQIEGRPTYLANLGPKPTEEESRPNMQRHTKGGRGRQQLGATAPLHAPTASSFHVASPSGSPKAVACRSPEYFLSIRPFHSYKYMGMPPPHNTTHNTKEHNVTRRE